MRSFRDIINRLDTITEDQEPTLRREVDGDGTVRWFNADNEYHRVDGPAIEYPDGSKKWYLNGKEVDAPGDQETTPRREVDGDGTIRWFNADNKYHRVDGPAIEYANGSKLWLLHGKRHRDNGPALELADGSKKWYLNGKEVKPF